MFEDRSYCGDLSVNNIGKDISLAGWIHTRRDHGGVIFIVLRDVSGFIQVVVEEFEGSTIALAEKLRNEYCIKVTGKLRNRDSANINPNMKNGDLEVLADKIELLSESAPLPFSVNTRDHLNEEVRLKYRFLDLRREEMQESMIMRHKVMQTARTFLVDNRFIEIETPILNKSTPEGARDFLVPSRLHAGEFYALPQSPQLFKQILMISGFDRYFNIVKCFRDEDLRNDRQPEFTQIDMELSFITPGMIMDLINKMLFNIVKAVKNIEIDTKFPILSYDEAMDRYGKDAPDTRFDLELKNVTSLFVKSDFKVFSNAVNTGGIIKALPVPYGEKISRKMIDEYTDWVKIFKAGGLPNCRYRNGVYEGGMAKFISDDEKKELENALSLSGDTIIFFGCDKSKIVNDTLGNLRLKIARDLDLIDKTKLNFLWVTDFPLFEYSDEDKRYYAVHHPFTAPKKEDLHLLDTMTPENIGKIKALAYDIVLNGSEIGGGSIRINTMDLQSRIFSLIGITEEEAKVKFSFLLEALQYGAPPHGGIALGLDRVMMLLLNRESIREVIAFPKTQKGQCLMSHSPSPVAMEQLRELSLRITGNQNA